MEKHVELAEVHAQIQVHAQIEVHVLLMYMYMVEDDLVIDLEAQTK